MMKKTCRLFHVTTATAAAAILAEGFRDGSGGYGTIGKFTGVWLSDSPLDVNEGAEGDTVLMVSFSIPLSALADYEWIEEGKGYREWLVPAEVIRRHATVLIVKPR
jgi:hypothetical protein